MGSSCGHIYARSRGGADHGLNYMMVGANFNLVFGNVHDPIIAYCAGAGRTHLAYLVSKHFAGPGAEFADPVEVYLAGKNAVWGCKEKAMKFFALLDE